MKMDFFFFFDEINKCGIAIVERDSKYYYSPRSEDV